ncbi:alternate-type signal peptide domain-containing protein [Rhodococcoides kyotonense]|uniref:Alternate signal-mediated exported protein, RER_14450 family n=1 Tax=Rhodococcoides kyotonense TaxID=398843 RepID=A0A239JAL8_9NOCA|nr:alternate-type signal peptide domain-containing protein [Rhodococcus kyotonensis]SNT01684.1 alternate signal-mediated exported protein, RER_14450 family [Rhodococcus kyotonensis]
MNKATKGAIAAAAAGVLLLGGAGSYALWSDSQTAPGGTVTAGELRLVPVNTGQWTEVSTTGSVAPGPIADISAFKMVPGDVLEYDASYTVAASGNNLTATISASQDSIARTNISATDTPVTVTSKIGTTDIANNAVTSADNGKTVAVKVRLEFLSTTTGLNGQNGSVGLTNFKIDLTQTRS